MYTMLYNKIQAFTVCCAICAAVTALPCCSAIADDERLIEVKPDIPAQPRRVLLEAFTGQRCVNCPRGTEVIEQLQQEPGDTTVIAVGIHGGPLAFAGNARTVGLATTLGNDYYSHWKLEYQPVGLINRGAPTNYTDWTAAVVGEMAKEVVLNLSVQSAVEDGHMNISVEATAIDHDIDAMLQVWVLEDGITALQLMPDGSSNASYVHNHVLRAAVNGMWGEEISLQLGCQQYMTFTQEIDPAWNPENIYAVAFVYTDGDVLQVATGKK